MKRENPIYESFKCLIETRNELAEKELKRIQEAVDKKQAFMDNYHIIKEMKERKDREHGMLMEAARNDALATVVKAIYMTALEAEALTDDGIVLAESMVDSWIQESGGASKILGKVGNNTYLLSRITQIVEDAAEAAVKEIEDDSDAPKEEKEPSQKEKKEDALKATKEFLKDASTQSVNDFVSKVVSSAQSSAVKKAEEKKAEEEVEDAEAPKEEAGAEDKKEDSVEEPKTEETPTEDDSEEEKSDGEKAADDTEEKSSDEDTNDNPESSEDANDDSDDEEIDIESIPSEDEEESEDSEDQSTEAPEENDEEASEEGSDDKEEENTLDDSVSDDEVDDDLGTEPLDDDGQDSDSTIDGDTENKGEIFDELEKEDDVQKAIDLIKTRVADAEEQFIRNNAEDKKKMDEVLNKISTNVKTVEDLAGKVDKKSETKVEIAKEAARMSKREYDNIVNNRPLTIFEKMTRKLGSGIIKNDAVRESYVDKNGSLDIDHVVESAKVMYGFLETINTLRLENVNEKYIAKVLKDMN